MRLIYYLYLSYHFAPIQSEMLHLVLPCFRIEGFDHARKEFGFAVPVHFYRLVDQSSRVDLEQRTEGQFSRNPMRGPDMQFLLLFGLRHISVILNSPIPHCLIRRI